MRRNSVAERATPVEYFFEFALLGMLASGYLAVAGAGYLDLPTLALTGLGLVIRALLAGRLLRWEFSPRLINALALAYIGFYPLDYSFLSKDFLKATVHLVFFLAVLKVLTARTERDYLYVKIIAFLELLSASIFSANANFSLFLALFVLFAVATFTSGEIRRSARESKKVVGWGWRLFPLRLTALTAFTVLGILVMTGGLFFLLPRTARAAFQRLAPRRMHLPGFSNEVSLGQIGELKMQGTTVLHARVQDDNGSLQLKWRGAALTQFDGRKWSNASNHGDNLRVESGTLRIADQRSLMRLGARINYEVQLRDVGTDVLFLAGIPEYISIRAPVLIRTASDSFRLGYPAPDQMRYAGYSLLEEGASLYLPEPLGVERREMLLRLPAMDERIGELARRVAAGGRFDEERARAIETFLRKNYGYTTELLKEEVPDPLAHFLFTRRKGHCEYFASAMAVMLRLIGIPSRVATGFQSGTYNPISGWYMIRASDAHSWVEAWMPGRGWTTFDPTPPDASAREQSLFSKLQLYMDAAETFWQEWVLSYDLERQLLLAERMERSSHTLSFSWLEMFGNALGSGTRQASDWAKERAPALIAAAIAILLAWIFGPQAWKSWKTRQRVRRVQRGDASASDATLLYQRMLELLHRRGFEKPAWLTPREFANMLPDSAGSRMVADLTVAYNDLRFGGRRDAAARMVTILEALERRGSRY